MNKGSAIVEGNLQGWIWQTEIFGLHFACLDIRQESGRNTRVVAEVARALGLCPDYIALDEEARRALLHSTLGANRDFPVEALSADTRETLDSFKVLHQAAATVGEDALGGNIISMTHRFSDILAALWLMELRLTRSANPEPAMDIIPLFETIQDLERARGMVEDMLQDHAYRRHLARRGNVQIVMIGYSDSTKDGGYLAACWALYKTQSVLSQVAEQHDVRLIFFHGRGGALGRGGGPAARTILALPPESLGAGLRMTEQGEVLADRYDDPRIAGRHLEQVIWATVAASVQPLMPPRADWQAAMEELASSALAAYRSLIEEPCFLSYFEQATPILEIESMPIASRPAHRHGARGLSDLRAIPWVFAWTQNRCMIPAWFGIGSAFQAFARAHSDGWQTLRTMYQGWPFFRATLDNAVLALAKSDMDIGQFYSELVEDAGVRTRIWTMISSEYERSKEAVLRTNGQPQLLEEVTWLQHSIRLRNPNTDPLNLLQVEWLRRLREAQRSGDEQQAKECRELLRLTIEGVAAGMRTTG
jgi:phosphoenolpyruvate carboxylase